MSLVEDLEKQVAALQRANNGELHKRRVAECQVVSLEHELTELRKYVGTLEDHITDLTIDKVDEIKTTLEVPEFNEILERAKVLWPKRTDFNPRTLREDAMLNVVIVLVTECYQALVHPIYDRAAAATRPAEPEVDDDG